MVKYLQKAIKPTLTTVSSLHGHALDPEKPLSNAAFEAVVFLGLLRHNEDQLVQRAKMLIKKDRAFFQKVFASKIDEWTPMHACTLRGARKLVKLALKAGVDANLEMGMPDGLPGRCTPLHLAAHRGDVSILQLLVQNGALLDKQDDTNCTPLYYALRRGNTLVAKKLLKYGADSSGLSREERLYYKDETYQRRSALLCIPVRTGSQKRKITSLSQKSVQFSDS
ncbi:unnamed protein product [Candidula unifasciata]|uniref:Uncharacterized protein n=1 Tax=Candidula unifasciata TaxID=100452 RepID=A0A8S3ZG78_9EUPU|nr:unnamed protein product [Candidula unifasciata]